MRPSSRARQVPLRGQRVYVAPRDCSSPLTLVVLRRLAAVSGRGAGGTRIAPRLITSVADTEKLGSMLHAPEKRLLYFAIPDAPAKIF